MHRADFWVGVVFLLGLVAFSFAGPALYRANPYAVHIAFSMAPPGPGHPLGADALGRNELARLMLGGQPFLEIGFAAAAVAVGLGTVVGLVSALGDGWLPGFLTWLSETALNIPQVVPLLLFEVLAQPSVLTFVAVIGGTGWPMVARLVRSQALRVGAEDYLEAARAQGAPPFRLYVRHVLPNIRGTLLVAASQQVNQSVLVLATVSFLAFGLPAPLPNWAQMVANSFDAMMAGAWWLVLPPGLAFVVLQVGVGLMADGLWAASDMRTGEATR
jgi:peptide/nickel transport system permease protein